MGSAATIRLRIFSMSQRAGHDGPRARQALLALAVTLLEPIDAAAGIDDLVLAGVERV